MTTFPLAAIALTLTAGLAYFHTRLLDPRSVPARSKGDPKGDPKDDPKDDP